MNILRRRTRIFFWRLRRWISPPARPLMGELVKRQGKQFDALSNSLRLAIYYGKRAHPDYRATNFFRVWSGSVRKEN